MDETFAIFRNGEEMTSTTRIGLGNLQVIVCNNDELTDELVAIYAIVDAGQEAQICFKEETMDKSSIGH
jgi:hypothetical protein